MKERSRWAKRELKKMLVAGDDAFDLTAIHEAAEELNIESPIAETEEYVEQFVPKRLPDIAKAENLAPNGFVYVIRSENGRYKIGSAIDVQRRLWALQCSAPLQLSLVMTIPARNRLALERAFHRRFASKRVRGEWFELGAKDLSWMWGFTGHVLESFTTKTEDI